MPRLPNYYRRHGGNPDPWRDLLAAIFVRACRDLRLSNPALAQAAREFLATPEAREWLTSEFNICSALPAFAQPQPQPCLIEARDHLTVEVN